MGTNSSITAEFRVKAILDEAEQELKRFSSTAKSTWQGQEPPKSLIKALDQLTQKIISLKQISEKDRVDSSDVAQAESDYKAFQKTLRGIVVDFKAFTKEQKEAMLGKEEAANIEKRQQALDKYNKTIDKNNQIAKKRKPIEDDIATAGRKISGKKASTTKATTKIAALEASKPTMSPDAAQYVRNLERQKQLQTEIAALEKEITKKRNAGSVAKEGTNYARQLERQAELERELASIDVTTGAQEFQTYNDAVAATDAEIKRLTDRIKENDDAIEEYEAEIKSLEKELRKMPLADTNQALSELRAELKEAGVTTADTAAGYKELDAAVQQLNNEALATTEGRIQTAIASAKNLEEGLHGVKEETDRCRESFAEQNEALNDQKAFIDRIKQFVGLQGAAIIARRAMTDAIRTVKELDAVMTEMATVTDAGIGDYWGQLSEHTVRANELGVAIQDVYKAETLYYQQGLKTNEVTAMSAQTLKMARISGLSAKDATDKMTAALRGFNMELNETSAQKVADVYAELAAITAADVKEISNAMSKTASIASSAGMEFETTAAFLSQIIETTRESAETAGTALKTVIARFQELKKDPSEIGEVDGEIVDANKIETALRTVGVALRDSAGQFRDLDDVFLELSSKWDSLDTNTQRYIATIAAGSRQQSRFIAMMSDYSRTQELVSAANTSAGASNKQFEKTMDSLEAKINKLKNAWAEFTMGIMDSSLVKFGVDVLTTLLNIINNITSGLGEAGGLMDKFTGALSKIGVIVTIVKLGEALVNKLFSSLADKATVMGKSIGNSIVESVKTGLDLSKKEVEQATEDMAPKSNSKEGGPVQENLKKKSAGIKGIVQGTGTLFGSAETKTSAMNEQLQGNIAQGLSSQKGKSLSAALKAPNMPKVSTKAMTNMFPEAGWKTIETQFKRKMKKMGKTTDEIAVAWEKTTNSMGKKGTKAIDIVDNLDKQLKDTADSCRKNGQEIPDYMDSINVNSILAGESIGKIGEEAEKVGDAAQIGANTAISGYDQLATSMTNVGMAVTGIGMACGAVGSYFEGMGLQGVADAFNGVGKVVTTVGGIMTGLGGVLTFLKPVFASTITQAYALAAGKTVESAGWFASAVGAIAAQTAMSPVLVIVLLITAAILALVVTIVALVAIFKAIKANSPEGKLKSAEEATEAAAEAAEQAAEAYNNLVSSLESLEDKYQTLDELTQGTKEWSKAIQEINNQILELIEQYPELAKFVENKEGILTLDMDSEEVQNVVDQYELKSIQAKNAEVASKISVAQKKRDVSYKNLSNKAELGNQFWLTAQKVGAIATTAALASTNTFAGAAAGHFIWADANDKRDQNKNNTNAMAEALAKGLIVQNEQDQFEITEGSEQELMDLGLTIDTIKEFTNELGKGAEELKAYGLRIQESKEQEKALYEALALNALSLVDTTNMSAREIAQISTTATQEYIDYFMDEASAEIDRIKKEFGKKDERNQLEELGKSVYGDQEIKVRRDKVIIGTGEEAEEIDRKEYEAQIASAKATEEAAKQLASLPNVISKISRDLGTAGKSFERAYFGKEGAKMTKADVKALDKDKSYWKKIFDDLTESEQKALGGFESFYNTVSEAIEIPKQAFKDIEEEFRAYGANFVVPENFTTEIAQGYSKQLKTVLIESGQGAANEVNRLLERIGKNLSAEDFEKFMSSLNALDWSDLSAWDNFSNTLKELGLNIPQKPLEEFIEVASETSQAIRKIELDKILEEVQSLQKLQKDISSGEQYRTFASDDYKSLIEKIPSLKNDFQLDEEGNYIYLGKSMQDLQKAIEDNTAAILQDTLNQLSVQNEAGKLIKEDFESVKYLGKNYKLEDSTNWDDFFKASWVQNVQNAMRKEGIDFSQLGIENFGKETDVYTLYKNDKDAVLKIFNDLTNLYTTYSEQAYEKLISGLTTEEMSKNSVASAIEGRQLREEAKTGIDEFDDIKRGKLESTVNNIVIKATQAGVNKVDIELYNKLIAKLKEMWEIGEAATNTKEYQQLLDYVEQIENKIIDATNTTTLNNNIQATLEKFAEMAEVINSVADEGTKIELIQKAVEDLGITITESNADLVVNLIRNILVGGKEGYEGLQILFESAAISAGLSGQQAGELWLNGWQGSLDTLREEFEGLYELFNLFANVGLGAWTIDENTNQASFERITEPQYTTNLSQSGAQIEEWETSYDWLYNANEKMNALIREREKAERAYNKALKDSSVTAEKLKEATEAELAALQKQAQVAVNQIEAANASITALFANNPEFAQFVSTSEDGRITIDYEGAEKAFKTNPEQGEAFEEFISITEELVETVLDSQDALEEIEDSVEEIQERGKSEYLDLEQRVYDAIIYQYESEIEKLENINSAIEEGNNNLISAIQAGINEARQARDNEKTEQDITDKQSRLAYLQMDTSGANALEILQLQKEIEEASEGYQDSLIDQAIQKLQESNDEAAQQRELQIALLTHQLQVAKESGELWTQFKELWDHAFDENGQLNMESSMVKTLQSKDGWTGMSDMAKKDWAAELQQNGALAKLYKEGYGEGEGSIPSMLAGIKTLTEKDKGVVATNQTIANNFDTKLSQTPADFGKDSTYSALFTGVSSAITGTDTPSNLFDVNSSITTGASDLSTALTTMFTNAQSAIDKAREEAERNANAYTDNGDGAITTTIDELHPEDGVKPIISPSVSVDEDFDQEIIDLINNASLKGRELVLDQRRVPTIWEATEEAWQKIKNGLSKLFNGKSLQEELAEEPASVPSLEDYKPENMDQITKTMLDMQFRSGEITQKEYYQRLEELGIPPYKTGGLADFTGPAWLDGTKSHPELVLNQQDTANFIELKDILAEILAGATVSRVKNNEKGGDNYYDIEISVENISEDYDVEQLAEKIKTMIYEDSVYRNVNTINLIR